MKKQYRNYSEQVRDNLELVDLCNDLNEVDEFYYEELYDAVMNVTSYEKVMYYYDGDEIVSEDSEEYYELENEYVWTSLESVYQLWKVELKGEWNTEHERLMVFWNEEIHSYVLPVFHFGTAWSYIGQCN